MQLPNIRGKVPTGLSFEIGDLMMLKGWAEFHHLRLVIDLDVSADEDEYEEVLAIYDRSCAFRRWMIWRSSEGIVVQPTMAHTMLFDHMSEALEILIPAYDDPPPPISIDRATRLL